MKSLMVTVFGLCTWMTQGQSIVGTWQLTDEKTCFESNIQVSETEKELLPQMGSSGASSVARTIQFDKKGMGMEGIFTAGKKKASDNSSFKYKVTGQELQLLDIKSGMMTQALVIDSLTQTILVFHDSKKDCEKKTFTRIK